MAAFVSGAVFGAAMVAGGLHHPATIVSQSKLQDWTALSLLLTATASSAAIYHSAEALRLITLKPRSSSPLGLFGTYGGNLLGGALLGAGAALSGAGPDTLVAQVGAGVPSGWFALGGAVVGGIMWTGPLSRMVRAWNQKTGVKTETTPLNQLVRLPKSLLVVLVEAGCAFAINRLLPLIPPGSSSPSSSLKWWSSAGVRGGLLIGVTQMISLLTRRTMIGISGSYEELGNFFWWLCGDRPRPESHQNILFWLGTLAGSWGSAMWLYSGALPGVEGVVVRPVFAAVGGCLVVVGSRLAGGCTSGHAISGLSLLSTASLVTLGSTLAGARLVGQILP